MTIYMSVLIYELLGQHWYCAITFCYTNGCRKFQLFSHEGSGKHAMAQTFLNHISNNDEHIVVHHSSLFHTHTLRTLCCYERGNKEGEMSEGVSACVIVALESFSPC